jgi:hypothetical protein
LQNIPLPAKTLHKIQTKKIKSIALTGHSAVYGGLLMLFDPKGTLKHQIFVDKIVTLLLKDLSAAQANTCGKNLEDLKKDLGKNPETEVSLLYWL